VGACIPAMHPAVRAVFQAVRSGLARSPETYKRLRLHFVGTSYAANGHAPRGVLALAHEAGIESLVDEQPRRIPYLASLQVMIDSHALLLVGSDEPHYTASKVFPYVLAERPLLALFHEESSVVRILNETGSARVIGFNDRNTASSRVDEICEWLSGIAAPGGGNTSSAKAEAFSSYSVRAMTSKLAAACDQVINGKRAQH